MEESLEGDSLDPVPVHPQGCVRRVEEERQGGSGRE
jgi:hypothetical protein